MSVINLLSSKIYNRIAAGEVVERPASVVKELVENSIDAGAKNVTVEITGGGITSIRVFDDGSGIEKSQLKKALLPHATSKISKVDDLDGISTLGFRGEALASIASVSKITTTSKPHNQESGATVYADGDGIREVQDYPSPSGTEITVNNLFYNTPARAKFLKTERGEESEITGIISKFILGNPSIAFKYISDGKIIYQSYGDGEESAMITVYGAETVKNCFYINSEKNGVGIKGYIGKQFFSKPNRTYQSVFLNGRYVINQTVSAAISNAYASYLMKRQYPFYVLSLSLPPETVDVNVHPNKTDVRFSDNRIVYGAVYSVVSKVLDGTGDALNIVIESENKSNETLYDYDTHNSNKSVENINAEQKSGKPLSRDSEFFNYDFKKLTFADSNAKSANFLGENQKDFNLYKEERNSEVKDIFAENKAYLESLEKKKNAASVNPEVSQQCVALDRELRFVGQVLNTYLIFDDGTEVLFVDQHAAHERILFDKFNEKLKNDRPDVQPLLVPYLETVNGAEHEFLIDNAELFDSMGIEISDFGGDSVKISALPTCLSDMNVKDFLSEILADLSGLKSVSVKDILKEKIAKKACKAAIKSGDGVNPDDVAIIADAVKKNVGLQCPHGRPVVAKISRNEMDKWFKRIV